MRKFGAHFICGLIIFVMMATALRAQDTTENEGQLLPDRTGGQQLNTREEFSESRVGFSLLKNIALDQKAIWTSPFHLHWQDGTWLFPLAAVTAFSVATDRSFVHALSSDPQKLSRYRGFSNDGVAALVGVGAGSYLWSHISHDEHERETGILSGEAVIDSLLTTQALKYSFGRERPTADQGRLDFFKGGNSFPSDHAAAAWSAATVIAHEYPGFVTKTLAYGLATAVSISAVMGKDHSPSDALVGSAIGWLIGREIYRAHHDPDLGGSALGALPGTGDENKDRDPQKIGSPFVPLDSWVYPAFERLAALGYVQSGYLGLRPWTRMECAQLLEEAGDLLGQQGSEAGEAGRLYQALEDEFTEERELVAGDRTNAFRVESVYTRVMDISGPPLRDSYHFGQTVINDFGRPYAEGADAISGFSGWASSGRLVVYVRGEYQHAPSVPAYSKQIQNFIAQVDHNPVRPPQPTPTTNQFTLLDSYVKMNLANWDFSFGKESLWWGSADGGALMLSDNAEPFVMFRARRIVASELPWIFRHLGSMETELFFGQLAGDQFHPRPLIHGEKTSFKPTPYLEFGLSRTVEFGGVGRPLTAGAVFNSYFSWKSSDLYPYNVNPGKRTLGFDFSYKVPHLRNWLTLYDDALLPEANNTPFDPSQSPIYAPRRTAMRPGIYLSRVPGVAKLDLRIEAVYTDPPTLRSLSGTYIYFNDYYHPLYTNRNNIIGDWIGREGMGFQGWGTYWFSPRRSLRFSYRHAKVAADFVPGGETLNDGSVAVNWNLHEDVYISGGIQYEKWFAPILAPLPQTNWMPMVSMTFWPRTWGR